MSNPLNAVKGLVVWRLVRDSFSLRESLPRSSMEISGIFDQQVVGFELGCPSNIIQKDALNTLATWNKGQRWQLHRHDDFTKTCKSTPSYKAYMVHQPIEPFVVGQKWLAWLFKNPNAMVRQQDQDHKDHPWFPKMCQESITHGNCQSFVGKKIVKKKPECKQNSLISFEYLHAPKKKISCPICWSHFFDSIPSPATPSFHSRVQAFPRRWSSCSWRSIWQAWDPARPGLVFGECMIQNMSKGWFDNQAAQTPVPNWSSLFCRPNPDHNWQLCSHFLT